jgi:hypothetical protein
VLEKLFQVKIHKTMTIEEEMGEEMFEVQT